MQYPWFKQVHTSKDFSNSLNAIVNNKKMTMGPQTTKVENYLKKFLKVKHVVLTTSGTSALMMATMAAEIKHDDVVISPNYTWVATTNPSKIMGADVKLVDNLPYSEKVSFKILNEKIKKHKPKLVLLVHLNGQPTYNKEFHKLKKKNKFLVIEDAAQSILSKTNARTACGTHYDIGCFSLGITKAISMVYGGFCTTNSSKLAAKLVAVRNNGVPSQEWFLKSEMALHLGLNLKPSDLHSSIGLINLKKNKIISKNLLNIYKYYKENLKNKKLKLENVEGKFSIPTYVQVFVKNRKKFISYCEKNKIGFHIGTMCLSDSGPFKNYKEKFPNAKLVSQLLVRLPSGPGYKLSDIAKIVKILNKY
tara:strand:+ start:269 stop:1357 length:1089 start_codon:yes stop_codon:yes gene_type:complete